MTPDNRDREPLPGAPGVEEWDGPLNPEEEAMIDAAWEKHKAARPDEPAPADVAALAGGEPLPGAPGGKRASDECGHPFCGPTCGSAPRPAEPEPADVAAQLAKLRETFCLASPGSDEGITAWLEGFDAAASIITAPASPVIADQGAQAVDGGAQQDRFDREMLRSMAASLSSGLDFSFNRQDMADLLYRMSRRIDPKPRIAAAQEKRA